jgi:hypothetical protein
MSAPCAESQPVEYDKPGPTLCFWRLTIISSSDWCGSPTLKLDNIRCAIAGSKSMSVAAVQGTLGRSSQSKTICTRLHLGLDNRRLVCRPCLGRLTPKVSSRVGRFTDVIMPMLARDARIWRVVCEDDKTT